MRYYFFSFLFLFFLFSCSSGPDFRISGTIDGLGTRNLRLVYYSGGAVQQVSAPAIDGKFAMEGRTDQPTLVDIYTSTGALVGRVIVEGGDDVECEFSTSEPYKMTLKGNDDSERLAAFVVANAKALEGNDRAALNEAVDHFVRTNPRRLVSGVLLTEFYDFAADPAKGLELVDLLDAKARPRGAMESIEEQARQLLQADSIGAESLRLWCRHDSLRTFPLRGGKTLLCFLTADQRGQDSVVAALRTLTSRGCGGEGLRVADISFDADSSAWLASLRSLPATRPDTASVDILRLWAPGGAASAGIQPLAVPSTPYFITADSAGRILYRGSALPSANL